MIEPAYYNNIYNTAEKQKNVVSWHGHFLVWGISRKELDQHLNKLKPRFTPIMPGLCAVQKKRSRLINSVTSFGTLLNPRVGIFNWSAT